MTNDRVAPLLTLAPRGSTRRTTRGSGAPDVPYSGTLNHPAPTFPRRLNYVDPQLVDLSHGTLRAASCSGQGA